MNTEMSYLLGMICGNGEIQRSSRETTISIEIPHKKLITERNQDVRVYVRASIADIRQVIEPLLGTNIEFTQCNHSTILSFTKSNRDHAIREILMLINNAYSHNYISLNDAAFHFTNDEKIYFLRGFSDVTGYIRRSNYYIQPHLHRVYLEIPQNWYLVIDVCNLLKDVDIPVQNIDWAHPNIRDGNLNKYNEGNINFWKKEHQIKIYANEFLPIGFSVIHKHETLIELSNELTNFVIEEENNIEEITHKFYWERRQSRRNKLYHPGENDNFIPEEIRGRHYNSWREIAEDLGYHE